MPRRVVVDTGPLVALFDRGDAHHDRSLQFIRRSRAELLSTLAVITEAMYVLGPSLVACKNLLSWVSDGALTLVAPDGSDFDRVIQLMDKYADLPMDFTDGLLVAVCERLGVKHIATVDSDFSVYRFKGRGKFINVFLQDSG